ncbi:MAG: IS110 family transposase [Prevotella sp.]|nr:IS110 family transposase [Prevotella sp.]
MQKYKVSFKGQNIYVGIDVHLKTWHVTTLTETGCKYSFAQHADAKELFDRLNKKFPEAHFMSAYEAGFCGFSAHYALAEQGIENIVVNAADIPTTGKEKTMKTDAVDSEKIAWALKRDELKGIYVKDKRYMDDTNLIRLRQRFIMDLSRQKNRTKHLLYTQGVTYPERFRNSKTHWSRNFMKWLREEVELLSEQKLSLLLLCDQVENTRKAILKVTREIRRLSTTDRYKENYDLLFTVPGLGLITSMSMLTELDNDIMRFPNERSFVSMLGLIPTCHDSGEKKVSGEKTNRGNKHLGPLIVEASWVAIYRDYQLGAYYSSCCQIMKPHKAIIKVARKLACRTYAVLKTKTKYELS